jgi:hypothetical protein
MGEETLEYESRGPDKPQADGGVAPADTRVYPRWGRWKIVLAYVVLFAVAVLSIWLIDVHVMITPDPRSP